jgi:hypothetical protein
MSGSVQLKSKRALVALEIVEDDENAYDYIQAFVYLL